MRSMILSQISRSLPLAAVLTCLAGLPLAGQVQGVQEQLWDAAIQGDTVALASALKGGAIVDSLDTRRNPNGRRALNWAAWYNKPAAIRFLAAHGADVNLANNTGFTPLHHAAEAGSVEAARALLSLGADRALRNELGQRPVDVARERNHPDVAAVLDSLPPQ